MLPCDCWLVPPTLMVHAIILRCHKRVTFNNVMVCVVVVSAGRDSLGELQEYVHVELEHIGKEHSKTRRSPSLTAFNPDIVCPKHIL